MNAAAHDAQAANWAGRGRGRGGGRGASRARGRASARGSGGGGGADAPGPEGHSTAIVLGDDVADGPTFTGISLKDLEFRLRQNRDGAESSLYTDDEKSDVDVGTRKRSGGGGGGTSKKQRSKQSKGKSTVDKDDLAAAAFGGSSEDEDDDDDEEIGIEDDMMASESASQNGHNVKMRGEDCAGCIMDRAIVSKVEEFVHTNATKMSEVPLFKAASLYYEQKLMAQHRREGVSCCKWPWKSIRNHFMLHVVDPVLARISNVRTLGHLKTYAESSLVRVEGDGKKQLDPKQCELLLKVAAMQSKELSLLDAARMPPPAPRGRGASASSSNN